MNKFNIIVPVYNSERWIGKCIESILTQDYPVYTIIVIDDCSTDRTWDIIKSYNVYAISNRERKGALHNIVKGIEKIGKDIIVTIDGDDFLADNKVLSYLNSVYTNDVWMTYGSFLPVSGKYKNTCAPLNRVWCGDQEEDGKFIYVSHTPQSYRKSGLWCTSHLRTFRKQLWDKINPEDLKENGEYYKVAWDMAFMYPMIEMAGSHVKFIDKILYMYNDLNPNCDGTLTPQEQVRTGKRIQAKDVYGELNSHIL